VRAEAENETGEVGPAERLHEAVGFVACRDGQRLALTEAFDARRSSRPGGDAFLLLHGFAQNRRGYTLGPMPRALLERGAHVFLGELRGHGDSAVRRDGSWTLADHLELDCPALLEGVRERTGVERVHLIGHSMGGLLGCALLERDVPLASLTAVATPLLLGAARPLVRFASSVVGPLAQIAPRRRRVPMDWFLRALAEPLAASAPSAPVRMLQRLTRLANPQAARPDAIAAALASADAESPAVVEELARNAVRRRPRLAGVDLVAALRGATLPVAAVVGSDDIFAPRAAVRPFDEPGHAGRRRVVEIPGGTHIDAILGHHVPETIATLWEFLVGRSGGSVED